MEGHGRRCGKGVVCRLAVLLGSAALLSPLAEPVGQRTAAVARYLLAMAATAMATPAQAQTVETLVSNIGQGSTENFDFNSGRAQRFTTGSNSTGYTLTGIGIVYSDQEGDNFGVAVCEVDSSGFPTSTCTDLTAPDSFAAGTLAFTASPGIPLEKDTTYTILVTISGSVRFGRTTSGNEDSGAATGWSLNNRYDFIDLLGDWMAATSGQALRVAIKGYANGVPTVANPIEDQMATVGTEFNFAFPATTFHDADSDTLTYSAALTDDSPLPGWLTFTPADRLFTGTPTTAGTITVRVTASDGTDTAHDDFQIKVGNSCLAPNFGTRRRIWTGTVTVGENSSGIVKTYGYDGPSSAGTLSKTDFDIGANNYTITGIYVTDISSILGSGDLSLDLQSSTGLTDPEVAALKLHVCDTTPYDLSDASKNSFGEETGYTWGLSLDWSNDSTRTLYLSLPENNGATGTPTITGSDGATVGDVLSANQGAIADSDGLPATFPDDYTFQWVREDEDGMNAEDISGETSRTYELTEDDVGKKVRVRVSFTDQLSGMEMRTSAPYPASGTVAPPPDNTAPTVVSIERLGPTTSPTNADALRWAVTFSEPVKITTISEADFTLSGTTATLRVVALSISLDRWEVVAASDGNLENLDGTVTLGFASDQNIQDEAGNPLTNTTPTGANENSYVVDNMAPMVTITNVPPTSNAPFTATITFNEMVSGFAQSDITAGNAILSDFTESTTTPGMVWTVRVTPTAPGEVTLDIGVNAARDAAGNGNTAATQATSDYTGPEACPAPAGDRESIWTGTVTVGAVSAPFIGTTGHGFNEINNVGNLNDKDFSIGERDYTIDRITVSAASGDSGDLTFSLTSDLTAKEKAALHLHVCNSVYNFSAASGPTSQSGYGWSPNLDWSSQNMVILHLSLPENNAATGLPTITSSDGATVGDMLTASQGAIADSDGLPTTFPDDYTVQWVREDQDGINAEDISGETSSTYRLAAADVDKKVRVRVSFTDDLGRSETRTSNPFPASGTVANITLPTVSMTGPSSAVDEGDALPFTLTLDEPASTDLSVNVAISETEDVVAVADKGSRTVTIPAGDMEATLTVATDDDDEDEANSEVTAAVVADGTSPATYAVGSASAVMVTVQDNDLPRLRLVGLSQTTYDEGQTVRFGLTREGDLSSQLVVPVTVSGGENMIAGTPPSSVTLAVGTATLSILIPTVNDDVDEEDSEISVIVSANAAVYRLVDATNNPVNQRTTSATVQDNDTRGVTVSGSPLVVNEGGTGAYRVELTSAPTGQVTITLSLASPGNEDVTVSPTTLTFTATNWDTPQTVTVTTTEDTDDVPDTATITHTVTGADYGANNVTAESVTVTVSEEVLPSVTIAADTSSITEGTAAAFTLTRTGDDTTNMLTVNVTVTQNGDVLSDTAPSSVSVTFDAGAAMATFSVATEDDNVDEDAGTVTAAVASADPPTYVLGTPASASMMVDDNDAPPVVTLLLSESAIVEAGGVSEVRATLNNPSAEDTQVTVAIPAEVTDAVRLGGEPVLVIPAGMRASDNAVTLTAVDNDAEAPDLSVAVSGVAENTVGVTGPEPVMLTITDDDATPVDNIAPTVIITNVPATSSALFTATITFSEEVNGFTVEDITVVNANLSNFTVTTAGTVWKVQVTPTANDVVTLNIAANVATDAANNGNAAASEVTSTYTAPANGETSSTTPDTDTTSPRVTSITRQAPDTSPTNGDSLTWRLAFSEAVTNVDAADFMVSGSTAMVSNVQAVGGERLVHDVTASGGDLAGLNGTVTLGFAGGQNIQDEAGNPLATTTPRGTNDSSYEVDNTAPTATYRPPTSLMVGTAITPITPSSTDRDVAGYSATALPAGLLIDEMNGVISGLPTTVSAAPAMVTVTVTDHAGNSASQTLTFPPVAADQPEVSASPASLSLNEGATTSYTVTLNTQPSGPVTITPTSEDANAVSVSPASLVFTPSDWNRLRTVSVTGLEDDDTDDETVTIAHAVSGADYGTVTAASVRVTVNDNDTADPTAPTVTYRLPASLTVGIPIVPIPPITADTDIASYGYGATGLPAGLMINPTTGVISGTPTTANTAPSMVVVTVTDNSGNEAEVRLSFPMVEQEAAKAARAAQQKAKAVLDEVVLPEVVQQLTAETTEVITSRLNTIASGSPSTPLTLSLDEVVADTVAAFHGERERLKNGSLEWRQALSGRDFVLPLSGLNLAQGQSASAMSGEGPFSTLALWGGGNYASYRNIIEGTNVDGNGFSAVIGIDMQPIPQLVTGLALTTSRWGLDYATDANGASAEGTYGIGVTMVNPYVNWLATEQLSLWATFGYGRGEVEQDPEEDNPTTRTDGLTSWAGGLRFQVLPGMDPLTGGGAPFGLAFKADGAASSFLNTQVQLARLAAEVSGSFAVENGLLTAALDLGWRLRSVSGKDNLDEQQPAIADKNSSSGGAELAGRLHWLSTDSSLSATVDTRVLLGGSHHREWGVGGYLRFTPSQRDGEGDGEGLSLTLQPSFGITGTKLDELWSLSGNSDLAINNDRPSARLDAELAYGFPLGNALLTPYAEVAWEETANAYGAGLHYGLNPSLELDLKGARRSGANGNNESRLFLQVRSDL